MIYPTLQYVLFDMWYFDTLVVAPSRHGKYGICADGIFINCVVRIFLIWIVYNFVRSLL